MSVEQEQQVVQQQADTPAAASAPPGMVPVMEIDYTGDPATIAREEEEAKRSGLAIVRKGEAPDGEREILKRMLFGGQEKPAAPVEVPQAVKDFFAQSGLGDADKVLNEYPAMSRQLQEAQQKLKQAESDMGYLAKLSPEALSIVQMDLDGKDWRKDVASRPALDFSKQVEKQDAKALAQAYGKGEITDEDWEEFDDRDGDPKVKAFVQAKLDLYKIKYAEDRDKAVNYAANQAALHKEQKEKFTASVERGLSELYAKVPGSEIYADKIRKLVQPEAIMSMFFEKDGVTLKSDAPRKAWLLSEMDTFIDAGMNRIQGQARDAATRDLLWRTPERKAAPVRTVAGAAGSSGLEAARAAVRKQLGLQ